MRSFSLILVAFLCFRTVFAVFVLESTTICICACAVTLNSLVTRQTLPTTTITTVIYWHFGNRYVYIIYISVIPIRKKRDV